jgi:hypothetical protein
LFAMSWAQGPVVQSSVLGPVIAPPGSTHAGRTESWARDQGRRAAGR